MLALGLRLGLGQSDEPSEPTTAGILTESGDYIITEDGDYLEQE